mgnify:CR=1 FL=1
MSIFENDKASHYKSATKPETMDDQLKGAGAKQMKADLTGGDTKAADMEKQSPAQKASPDRLFCAALPQFSLVTCIFWCPKPPPRSGSDSPDVGFDTCLYLKVSPNQFLGCCLVDTLPALGQLCDGIERDDLAPQSIKKASQDY